MSGAHLTKELWDAEELAKKLFLDDPDMSIDEAAREVDRHCQRSLGKDALSRVRREVRERINSKMGSQSFPAPAPVKPGFVNRPRLAEPKAQEAKVEANMAGGRRPMVDTVEKKKWFNDWAFSNPWSTIKEARASITTQFGEGLGTDYIAETLKTARHLVVEQRKDNELKSIPLPTVLATALPSEKPLREVIREVAVMMRAAGVKSIKINPDGSVDFESILTL